MPPEPRPELLRHPPVVHGSPDFAELRRLQLDPRSLLDFSANINPYGPPLTVRRAASLASLEHYPDREALDLRAALGDSLGVPTDCILVGNGSSELIWLTTFAFLSPSDRVLVLGPTYGEYARAAALAGAAVTTWQSRDSDGFLVLPERIAAQLAALRPRMVFVCNPNNPTGTVLDSSVLAHWARQNPETLFVIDEAYQAFARPFASSIHAGAENILVLRSMTKDHALAGLRIGYSVGHNSVIEAVARARPPWSVNAPAQAAGLAALAEREFLSQSLAKLERDQRDLVKGLRELGMAPLPSAVHFFLVRVSNAAVLRLTLAKRGILVRDAASFGLPEYVRIATRRPEENAQLLTVLREVKS